ncbi:MAG: polysaccharide pyruvyl transferase family protein [Planctomycetota bacterium]
MNALVLNHCAHNKGDRAVLFFVVRELAGAGVKEIAVSCNERRFYPAAWRVGGTLVSCVPGGWNAEMGERRSRLPHIRERIKGHVYRRLWWRLVAHLIVTGKLVRPGFLPLDRRYASALKSAGLVIGTGGHHLSSEIGWDGVCPNSFDMAAAVLSGKRVGLWSQTVGPFRFRDVRNRDLVRALLSRVECLYVRDTESVVEVERLGGPVKLFKTYESVLGLSDTFGAIRVQRRERPILGVAIYSAQARTTEAHAHYTGAIAEAVRHAIGTGWQVWFFPMEMRGSPVDDRPCIRDIVSAIPSELCQVWDDDVDTRTHLRKVAECDAFIGHKTHSTIFALLTGTPLLAIAYHRKTRDFMKQYRLEEFCIDECDLTGERLCAAFDRLRAALNGVAQQEWRTTQQLGAAVRRDFRDMISRLGALGAPALADLEAVR